MRNADVADSWERNRAPSHAIVALDEDRNALYEVALYHSRRKAFRALDGLDASDEQFHEAVCQLVVRER